MNRRHSMAGKRDLDWFFANKKWLRMPERSVVESAWAVRTSVESSAALQILLLAPKRSYRRAHERNRVKRWLRAAIAECSEFGVIEESAVANGSQVLVMLRCQKPLEELSWEKILAGVRYIAATLSTKTGIAAARPEQS